MPRYEYKVVPAPAKGRKAKGVKTPEGRFAVSVEALLNEMGAQGWEYLRAELLPSEERSGLTGSTKAWRNVLVFRRETVAEAAEFRPRLLESPVAQDEADPANAPQVAAPVPVADPVTAVTEPEADEDPDAPETEEAEAEGAVTFIRKPPVVKAPGGSDPT